MFHLRLHCKIVKIQIFYSADADKTLAEYEFQKYGGVAGVQ